MEEGGTGESAARAWAGSSPGSWCGDLGPVRSPLSPWAPDAPSQKDVDVLSWSTGPRVAAVAAELAPYAWRDLTESMLARRVVGGADRYSVLRLIHSVPGAAVGTLEPLEPAAIGDARVEVLARALRERSWRGHALDRLCADLLAVLDEWQGLRDSFDDGVRRMLDDR